MFIVRRVHPEPSTIIYRYPIQGKPSREREASRILEKVPRGPGQKESHGTEIHAFDDSQNTLWQGIVIQSKIVYFPERKGTSEKGGMF
jgi:hypothetical protein